MQLLSSRKLLVAGLTSLAALGIGQTYSVVNLDAGGVGNSFGYGIGGGIVVGISAGNATQWDLSGNATLLAAGATAWATDGTSVAGTDDAFLTSARWPVGGGAQTSFAPFSLSTGYGVSGSYVVGAISDGLFGNQPFYWDWTAASPAAVTLAADGEANCIFGTTIGGQTGGQATIWSIGGGATSLHPATGYSFSTVRGISATNQVGDASPSSGGNHAMLWTGSAASFVDLHPAGWLMSFGRGTNGTDAVGYVDDGGGTQHAAVWLGSAHTFLDLHSFLGPGFTSSVAYGIDSQGRISGAAFNGRWQAVVWKAASYTFGNFKQPINDPDDDRVSSFKRGSVIPVMIRVYDSEGNIAPNLDLRISLTKTGDSGSTPVDVDDFDGPFDRGDRFWFVPFVDIYVYLLSTKELDLGHYLVRATVQTTGDFHEAEIKIRR